ncbi:Nudix hydrolase 3, partial [Turnera subulata]
RRREASQQEEAKKEGGDARERRRAERRRKERKTPRLLLVVSRGLLRRRRVAEREAGCRRRDGALQQGGKQGGEKEMMVVASVVVRVVGGGRRVNGGDEEEEMMRNKRGRVEFIIEATGKYGTRMLQGDIEGRFKQKRSLIHQDGDYHKVVYVLLLAESTQQLLLQRRADRKDSYPGLWDVSCGGHVLAGDSSLVTAMREVHEELGVALPKDDFEFIFVYLRRHVLNGGTYINNEIGDVYLVTTADPIPLEAFTLQESEVSDVKYIDYEEYRSLLAKDDPSYVPYAVDGQFGQLFDIIKKRSHVLRDGDYHKAVYVLLFAETTQQLLLRRRADSNDDSFPALWDVSGGGPALAGTSSLVTARKDLHEKLGVALPKDAFESIFVNLPRRNVLNDGTYINNELGDVYLVTIVDPIPLEAFTLQGSEVSDVKYIDYEEYRSLLAKADPGYVPYDVGGQYGQLFYIIKKRYTANPIARSLTLEKQIRRYAPVVLDAEVLTGLSDGDKEALVLIVKAAKLLDEIFYHQVWCSNPALRDWLKEHADASEVDKLKWKYYLINKCPWSTLDENEAFLTTADSSIKLIPEATKSVHGWKGVEYKAAFPMLKPPGANFYPSDMEKMEFEFWKNSLGENGQHDATSFFTVIKRRSESELDSSLTNCRNNCTDHLLGGHDLYSVPYSKEYNHFLAEAAQVLHKAGELVSSPSLKRLLHSKADAFLSNDYYDSDIAWMELDSKLDITIGPYETYKDAIFGYKATFEAFIGIRDDKATAQLKLFGDNLQVLEEKLPMDSAYKSKNVNAAPIRVIQLIYNAGDVAGTQPVAFNLPNDERIVKERGTSMVMLKNVSEAKFKHILLPIADACISKEQKEFVEFESFFTHIICHECCHGIGPHTITVPNGQTSTVRKELQELHSALEEAKADVVGLWALKFLISQDLLPKKLVQSMYVSILAGCFRSVRFGLKHAHGKGQALQFNWLFEKGAYVLNPDETFSVDFSKVEEAVESLSREILTIQAKGDKAAASSLFDRYCKITQPLTLALKKLENVQVPVDIAASFPIEAELAD